MNIRLVPRASILGESRERTWCEVWTAPTGRATVLREIVVDEEERRFTLGRVLPVKRRGYIVLPLGQSGSAKRTSLRHYVRARVYLGESSRIRYDSNAAGEILSVASHRKREIVRGRRANLNDASSRSVPALCRKALRRRRRTTTFPLDVRVRDSHICSLRLWRS